MKTYKVKNYKGNLVESLSKFQKNHKGMKIVEAVEDGDDLKIKAEENKRLQESSDFWSTLDNKAFSVGWDESNGTLKAFSINTERDMYSDGSLEKDCIVVFSYEKNHLKEFFDINEIPGIDINKIWNLKPGQELKYGYDNSDDIIDRGIVRRIF